MVYGKRKHTFSVGLFPTFLMKGIPVFEFWVSLEFSVVIYNPDIKVKLTLKYIFAKKSLSIYILLIDLCTRLVKILISKKRKFSSESEILALAADVSTVIRYLRGHALK